MSEFLRAVKTLVALLREHFRPHGHPPKMASWESPCAHNVFRQHPFRSIPHEFSWLLGHITEDGQLSLLFQSIKPARDVIVALKRVESLLMGQGNSASHFRASWQSLLSADWLRDLAGSANIPWNKETKTEMPTTYTFGVWPSELDAHLLSDLLKTATLVQPPLAAASDVSSDRKRKSNRRPKRGPRNIREFARFKTAIDKGINKGRQQKDIALDFAGGDEKKAKALIRQLQRHKDLPG